VKGALEGVRIADFSWLWAGAYATELLAFLGAEVVKIESRKRPDRARLVSLTTGQVFSGLDESPVFNHLNLNKLDVSIDLKDPPGG
jgi:benzylsuccinate CoA-transferase BbsF subunit